MYQIYCRYHYLTQYSVPLASAWCRWTSLTSGAAALSSDQPEIVLLPFLDSLFFILSPFLCKSMTHLSLGSSTSLVVLFVCPFVPPSRFLLSTSSPPLPFPHPSPPSPLSAYWHMMHTFALVFHSPPIIVPLTLTPSPAQSSLIYKFIDERNGNNSVYKNKHLTDQMRGVQDRRSRLPERKAVHHRNARMRHCKKRKRNATLTFRNALQLRMRHYKAETRHEYEMLQKRIVITTL